MMALIKQTIATIFLISCIGFSFLFYLPRHKQPIQQQDAMAERDVPKITRPRSHVCKQSTIRHIPLEKRTFIDVLENTRRFKNLLCYTSKIWQSKHINYIPSDEPEEINVLGLARKSGHRAFMRYKMSGLKTPVHYVDAVDCIIDTKCYQYYSQIPLPPKSKRSPLLPVSYTSVGILFTWKQLLTSKLKTDAAHLVILEDDVYLVKFERLYAHWKEIVNVPMALLGAHQLEYSKEQLEIQKHLDANRQSGFYFTDVNRTGDRVDGYSYGSYGIVLSRPLMHILLEIIEWMITSPDRYTHLDIILNGVLRLIETPAPIFYPNLVVPEVRESGHIGAYDIETFSISRRIDYTNAASIDMYEPWTLLSKQVAIFSLPQLWSKTGLLGTDYRSTHRIPVINHFLNYTTLFAIIVDADSFPGGVKAVITTVCRQSYDFFRLFVVSSTWSDGEVEASVEPFETCRVTVMPVDPGLGRAQTLRRALLYVHDVEYVLFLEQGGLLLDENVLQRLDVMINQRSTWPISAITQTQSRPLAISIRFQKSKGFHRKSTLTLHDHTAEGIAAVITDFSSDIPNPITVDVVAAHVLRIPSKQ